MLNMCNTKELNLIQSTQSPNCAESTKKYKQYKNVGFNLTRTAARKTYVFVFLSPFSQVEGNTFGRP